MIFKELIQFVILRGKVNIDKQPENYRSQRYMKWRVYIKDIKCIGDIYQVAKQIAIIRFASNYTCGFLESVL